MLPFILRRVMYMIPTLIAISIVSFILIQLPPGDYLTSLVASLQNQGISVDEAQLKALEERYGLNQPIYVQYFKWIKGILLHGDFGQSFEWRRPVSSLIWQRLGLTVTISLSTLLFVWAIAFPIGIYSAVKQYSIGDYIATFFGFIGLATPNFLLALVLMYVAFAVFGQNVGGLFSPEYVDAPWSLAKVKDLISHLWIPMIVIGTSGTASLIRVMRANLLDELQKLYVVAARARGLSELKLLLKHPVRVALNPFVSGLGWLLPQLVSGSTIVSVVLSLPTTGPMAESPAIPGHVPGRKLSAAAQCVDVIGTLISDILLAWLDPRIRYQ